jgi:hypothetical protein
MYFYNPPKSLQGMTNHVGLIFSVDDTILWLTFSIEQPYYPCNDNNAKPSLNSFPKSLLEENLRLVTDEPVEFEE